MRKSLNALASVLLTVLIVGVSIPASAQVRLTFWHGWAVEHERVAMEKAVKLFNDAHPNLKVEAIPGKTNEQILAAISAGNPPDVGTVWNTQTLAQWAAQGALTDLEELVKATGFDESALYPVAAQMSKYKGRWYGLPIEMNARAVYYNKGLFRAAGLDPEKPPKTLEEMFQMAEKLTKVDASGNVTQLGFSGRWADEAIVLMYGGRWWDPGTGQPTANDPNNVAGWTLLGNYHRKFGAAKVNTFNSQKGDNPLGSLFLAGKVAMRLDGDWVTVFLPRFAPNIEWGLFPLPPAAAKPELAHTTPIDGAIYVVPTGVKRSKEAWEFVRWMATSKEVSCLLQKEWANASALPAVGKDEKCLPTKEFKGFLDLMGRNKMHTWPPIAVSTFYHKERVAAFDRVVFGQQDAKEALDALQTKTLNELRKVSK